MKSSCTVFLCLSLAAAGHAKTQKSGAPGSIKQSAVKPKNQTVRKAESVSSHTSAPDAPSRPDAQPAVQTAPAKPSHEATAELARLAVDLLESGWRARCRAVKSIAVLSNNEPAIAPQAVSTLESSLKDDSLEVRKQVRSALVDIAKNNHALSDNISKILKEGFSSIDMEPSLERNMERKDFILSFGLLSINTNVKVASDFMSVIAERALNDDLAPLKEQSVTVLGWIGERYPELTGQVIERLKEIRNNTEKYSPVWSAAGDILELLIRQKFSRPL